MTTLPNPLSDLSHWTEEDFEKIRINAVCETVGASVPTIYRRISLGKFPPPAEPGEWFKGQIRDHKRLLALQAKQKQAALRSKQPAA